MNNSSGGRLAHYSVFIDADTLPVADAAALCEQAVNAVFNYVLPQHADGYDMQLNIKLADDDEVHQLNHAYRGKDKATNVLSFVDGTPLPDDSALCLGDIIIAKTVLEKEAKAENKKISQHLQHLTVHGVLHLFGFDHINDHDADMMEALEIDILHTLNIPNPYQDEGK